MELYALVLPVLKVQHTVASDISTVWQLMKDSQSWILNAVEGQSHAVMIGDGQIAGVVCPW